MAKAKKAKRDRVDGQVKKLVTKLAHDPRALELVVLLGEELAARSRLPDH